MFRKDGSPLKLTMARCGQLLNALVPISSKSGRFARHNDCSELHWGNMDGAMLRIGGREDSGTPLCHVWELLWRRSFQAHYGARGVIVREDTHEDARCVAHPQHNGLDGVLR